MLALRNRLEKVVFTDELSFFFQCLDRKPIAMVHRISIFDGSQQHQSIMGGDSEAHVHVVGSPDSYRSP